MTETQWQQKRSAVESVLHFMGTLNTSNSYLTMQFLWDAMDAMISRYGELFVADSIRKSRAETELALYRHGRQGAV